MSGIILGAVLAIAAGWLILGFNGLVTLRNRVKNAWSQIDVQLKRRYDLIPNLVETVKGYMSHERETLERVVKARNMAIAARGVDAQARAENVLTESLKSLFALAERYPDLKANENARALQEELTGTENKIAFARQFYNDMVMHYNIRRQVFPINFIARFFNFEEEKLFDAPAESREAVKVSLR